MSLGAKRWPRPCRGRKATRVSPIRPVRIASDGSPQGLSTRRSSQILDAGEVVHARAADDAEQGLQVITADDFLGVGCG